MIAILFCPTFCLAQSLNLSDWKTLLLDKKDAAAARKLCQTFAASGSLVEQVEAEKCLSNVAMFGADAVHLQNDESGHPVMFDEWIPEAVDESLAHLNRGLQLAPQDLSIHQGRLHVLEISRRYDEMAKALDESCDIYKGKEAPAVWLDYPSELNDLHAYEPALKLMKVLEKHYPNSPDIVGNIGAFLSILKRDSEAIPYLERAVALAPDDPINAWDLAREYDYAGKTDQAAIWYPKALSLMKNSENLRESYCLYAEFLEKKLKERARACDLEKQYCSKEAQTACP
ncbi:MAG TPA: hypothetical protein VF392_15910 [Terracidiphilus sp.]